ncbi:hypothetical protein GCM10012275_05040 [Longimycelium tulufanense]|uniref:Uncharacterized protein n=1 Tax=Longimycelium tulufanense TaxID=907463 RepID=A0A8J3CBX9_9PSEU|nr:hypothetical protein [Longimycelium tulufanense]GGM36867.1 hypothetical protein GCM10012275_05040 [Longimycelium tulufanense]
MERGTFLPALGLVIASVAMLVVPVWVNASVAAPVVEPGHRETLTDPYGGQIVGELDPLAGWQVTARSGARSLTLARDRATVTIKVVSNVTDLERWFNRQARTILLSEREVNVCRTGDYVTPTGLPGLHGELRGSRTGEIYLVGRPGGTAYGVQLSGPPGQWEHTRDDVRQVVDTVEVTQ